MIEGYCGGVYFKKILAEQKKFGEDFIYPPFRWKTMYGGQWSTMDGIICGLKKIKFATLNFFIVRKYINYTYFYLKY